MRIAFLFLFYWILTSIGEAQVTLHSESFETNGEGVRYTSNSYDEPFPDCNFFGRQPASPLNTCFQNNFFSNFQGSFFWGSEDIRKSPGVLPPGSITSQDINISGYNNLSISLYLATANNNGTRWETDDSINVQISIDGGPYITRGRFMGNGVAPGGELYKDNNLNGAVDVGEPIVSVNPFTQYTFNFPGTGTNLKFRLDFDQLGGSEELGIDLIEVKGIAVPAACPNTNPAPFCTTYNATGLALNNRFFVCDLVAGEYQDIVLTGGNTYRVDFCGFSGGTSAPSYNSLITVYNQTNNTLIGFNDDFCGDDPQLDFVAPVSGTYRVLANISGNCSGTNSIFTPLGLTLINVGTAPIIAVTGNGQPITDGDTTPSTTDNTSFGSIPACNGTIAKSFTIQNTGTSNLTISGVSFTGGNATDFSVTSAPAATVTPGNSTTFQVTFNPSATGLRSTTLEIANNVAGSNPFNFSIEGNGAASPLVAQITSSTDVLCFGQNTGSMTVTVSNGTANYNYLWSNGSTTNNSSSTTNTISMLVAGTYTVTVSDMNGCTASTSRTITQPMSALNATTSITNVTCINGANGFIDLTPTGGTPGYTYSWSNGTITQDVTGLVAGTYTVTVTDVNGCTTTKMSTVAAPSFTITGNNILIIDGDPSPSLLDGTDFGTQSNNSTTPQTFVLTNANLAITINAINSNSVFFALSSVPMNLGSNAVEDFIVSYQPTTSGSHTGIIEVLYNGCAQPYDFAVSGQTCTGNNFTFIGPGTDPQQSSNWLNGCVPPPNNVNTVVTIQSVTTLILNGPFTGNIINNGTLRGSVLLNGNLTNNGKVSPGN